MKRVNVSGLRKDLSRYLREVRHGEEVLVMDRQTPVAKLVHASASDAATSDTDLLSRLVERGVLASPRSKLRADFFTDMPATKHSAAEAILDERERGR